MRDKLNTTKWVTSQFNICKVSFYFLELGQIGFSPVKVFLVTVWIVLAGYFSACSNPSQTTSTKITARETCYTSGRFLYAPNGEKIILRGVNKMNVVTDITGEQSFPEIRKTGANVVRIMWMKWGGGGPELNVIIRNSIRNNLIPMIELHDATGKWGEDLYACVDFWLREDVLEVIKKYEGYILLNIANEAGGYVVPNDEFAKVYSDIVFRMRSAGIRVPLVIDASNWGRNEENLLATAEQLIKNDPLHNLIFSWHIWDSGISNERIYDALKRSIDSDIPFIIGEYAPMEVKCKCCIPYHYIMDICQKLEIGWLAWSWGPGNKDCPAMDMTHDGTFESLHGWGLEVALTHPNSIFNTSVRPSFIN
ncbi:cellulase family glycosylhydrolase [Alkaliflexus imshenetskii]|uniref:cellulase family glycosylhydrolase n=1 Tax=Alkaliflexus imshenetskii TaxID=286730 RepID=UPI0004AEF3CE|nr:cellulase family glycosylhydrolase [Alkaliflexus imshenetskii]